jgi:5'-nucleotidase
MKTFTILHTNDMHSAFIGMGPSSDYSPFTLNDDATRGGYARLASLIATRRDARAKHGAVLVLDAGDYSMGTPFGAATREIGGELQLMGRMGYDATTFGNHEFDLGPDGLGRSISVAAAAGRIPAVLAGNSDFSADDPALADLQHLRKNGLVSKCLVFERGGLRFGLFGVIGKEAIFYTSPGAVTFSDAIETAKEIVAFLRDIQKVDVVIALSHGGLEKDADGHYSDGDDVRLAAAVPGIDVVIGGHSHTELHEPILVNGRTPVVQTGREGRNLGELVITLDDGKLTVDSCQLHPIDDSIAGDPEIDAEIDTLKQGVTAAVFASRGYRVDQPLAIAPIDLTNSHKDLGASTLLANLCTDAYRHATKADVGFSVNGMMRAALKRGKSGVQTVYDVFAVAPLGAGVIDNTAGSALVTGWFTGRELKNLLEFFLVDNPAHPGEYFPRTSGLRFHYDKSRPTFDVVTMIELGDLDHGYQAIDTSGKDERLYSVTTPLMLGSILAGIPKYTKGALPLAPKTKDGQPLTSRMDALDSPRRSTAQLMAPRGSVDKSSIAVGSGNGPVHEIKEWQAIMDHLRRLPKSDADELPTIPVDARAAEVRAIKTG